MIVGAVVFELRAAANCELPVSHGRLLHAALLNLVRAVDSEASLVMHDSACKNFSLNTLVFQHAVHGNTIAIKKNETAFWRVCALGEDIFRCLMAIRTGIEFRVGKASFVLKNIFYQQEQHVDAGAASMEYLLSACRCMPLMRSLTLEFVSPTVFKVGSNDYAFPLAELIFASIAEKWNSYSDVGSFDIELIKDLAGKLLPINWSAETRRYNITKERGITGFVGRITYDMRELTDEYRWIFILLAEFAVFTGVGRLTAQGLGHIKITYRQ